MAILDIRVLGDPILREQTIPVTEVTDDLRTLIDDMFETMYAADGIGLAAPQVGRKERIAVIDIGESDKLVIINPEIVSKSNPVRADEGCLSIPELGGIVERPSHVVVRALDKDGNPFELEAEGLLARAIQHETDHLHGRLFIDYLSILKRRAALRDWEAEAPKYPNFIRKLEPLTTPRTAAEGRSSRHASTVETEVDSAEE